MNMRIFSKINNWNASLWEKLIVTVFFSPRFREILCRKEFFYNAFKVLAFNGISGDYVEFGCCGGMTFSLAYRESIRHKFKAKFWAFDSFQGLPAPEGSKDDHPVWKKGSMFCPLDHFVATCDSHRIPRSVYKVVPGFYNETLSVENDINYPVDIALVYIDCDLYSSTKLVIDFLKSRLKHGMIIAFDDYFCWSETQVSGEKRALQEFLSANSRWKFVPYMQFGWHGHSFVIEDSQIIS